MILLFYFPVVSWFTTKFIIVFSKEWELLESIFRYCIFLKWLGKFTGEANGILISFSEKTFNSRFNFLNGVFRFLLSFLNYSFIIFKDFSKLIQTINLVYMKKIMMYRAWYGFFQMMKYKLFVGRDFIQYRSLIDIFPLCGK